MGPVLQVGWGCVSVCCLCSALGLVPAQNCLSDCYSPVGHRNSCPPWPPGPGDQGIDHVHLLAFARLQERGLSMGHTCSFSDAGEEPWGGALL